MIDFVRYRWWFILFSLVVIVPGVISMLIPPAFRIGIEFAGGSALSVDFNRPVEESTVRDALNQAGHGEAIIQRVGDTGYLIRTRTLAEAQRDTQSGTAQPSDRTKIENALLSRIDPNPASKLTMTFDKPVDEAALKTELSALGHQSTAVTKVNNTTYTVQDQFKPGVFGTDGAVVTPPERETLVTALSSKLGAVGTLAKTETVNPWRTFDVSSVSAVIAQETVRNAILAVVAACFVILLFIWLAFRKVQGAFVMGATAVIAVVHDVLVTLGMFSILSKFMPIEVNAMFITGMLTVVGYSVHDTIVVFDRIRENSLRYPSRDLATNVNFSLSQTLGRSINTSVTTLIVIVTLLALGGQTIESFLLILLIGIITGTYSSIFVASQMLIIWWKHELLGPFSRKRSAEATATVR
ncbi:MAG: protein translocase subunit SecF [Dehalococcoidia bacterium]|nr:protein translocase subunit SecF [Dehalococcoidia bacterium]